MFSYTDLFFFLGIGIVVIGFLLLTALLTYHCLEGHPFDRNAKIMFPISLLLLCAGGFLLYLSQNESWVRKDLCNHNKRILELEHKREIIKQKINDFEADENRILSPEESYEYSSLYEINAEVYKKIEKLSDEASVFENDLVKKKSKEIKKKLEEADIK